MARSRTTKRKIHRATSARAPRPKSGWPEARLAFDLQRGGRIAEAIDGYRAALSENPKMAGAWYALGCAELARNAIGAAIPCFRRALSMRPGWAMARLAFGKALFGLGRVDAAIEQVRRAARSNDPAVRREALRYWAVIVPGGTRSGNRAVLEARRRWARLEAPSPWPGQLGKSAHAWPGKRPRVGYVSAFFASAHWMKPVWAAVNHHDRDAFEIHFFADRAGPMDAIGYRSHRLDRVHDLTAMSNEAAAHCVADAKIDVLVDLNAYSFPQRFGLFKRRPAPIQLGWFNTYATTGIDAFDYIVGDHAVIPSSEERFYTERVLRVAGSHLAFEVLHALSRRGATAVPRARPSHLRQPRLAVQDDRRRRLDLGHDPTKGATPSPTSHQESRARRTVHSVGISSPVRAPRRRHFPDHARGRGGAPGVPRCVRRRRHRARHVSL